jgi:hypothetical protein
MDLLTVIILTVLATIAISTTIAVYANSRKQGATEVPWEKIRPILSEVFIEAVKLMQARTAGYQGIEDYSVSFIKRKVDSADFISKEEKDFLTEDFIRTIITPRLKELYSEKVSKKRIGE